MDYFYIIPAHGRGMLRMRAASAVGRTCVDCEDTILADCEGIELFPQTRESPAEWGCEGDGSTDAYCHCQGPSLCGTCAAVVEYRRA